MHLTVKDPESRRVKDVLLNGKKIKFVVELDTEKGWLWRYKTTDDGKFVTDDDQLEVEKLYGKVEIVWAGN